MKFTTKSGSVYEINTDSKKIRRLKGTEDPTPRQGKDGEWRPYADIFPNPIQVGKGVVIAWGSDTPLLDETKAMFGDDAAGMPITTTSKVIMVEVGS
jgi:hypothetical protein